MDLTVPIHMSMEALYTRHNHNMHDVGMVWPGECLDERERGLAGRYCVGMHREKELRVHCEYGREMGCPVLLDSRSEEHEGQHCILLDNRHGDYSHPY